MLRDILEGKALLEDDIDTDWNWKALGRCAGHPDPDLWYAPAEDSSPRYAHLTGDALRRARKKDRDRAKEMCRACLVRVECNKYAMDNFGRNRDGGFGIWAALDRGERTRLSSMLAAAEAAA